MLFTSLEFLFMFLPAVLLIYFVLPSRLRNYWLLAASFFFYAWGEPVFLLFMLASIVFNYLMALGIDRMDRSNPLRRAMLAVDVLGNLSVLFVYKYMNFVTDALHRLFPWTMGLFEATSFALPIGISFFTFQAMSYVIDVYRGGEMGARVQRNPAYVGLYIAFFPQLIAGPIVRYTTIEEQIEEREVTFSSFSDGVYRFVLGFNKKMLLANPLALVADKAFATYHLSVGMAWLGIVCYTLQIYYDFSGYSDMAIGLGRMFGFRFLENFNYPYISKTITEFWRRWHISLGTWFRDYVYFPLGGSRVKSRTRLMVNLFVVWLLTGVWHGANWTFILWGVLYGVIITAEKMTDLPRRLPQSRLLSVVYPCFTLLAVMFGWVLFRADTIRAAGRYVFSLFGLRGYPVLDTLALFHFREYAVLIAAGVICATPALRRLRDMIAERIGGAKLMDALEGAVQIVLFVVGISALVMNAHNPFIYFNF
ncbi:MAG: MBOAT family protein [Clostridiales bacterium]|nr:MBOAT family protein [Clostridiales bacterium]